MEFVSHFDDGNFKSAFDMIEKTDFIGHNFALNYEIEIGDAASKLLGTQTKKLSVIHYALLNLDTHDTPEVNIQRRDILRALIEKVSLDLLQERSENGNTPVHVAAFLGETEILELILARKASANMENKLGLRPVDMASNSDTINLLKKYIPLKAPRHKKGKSSSREPSLSPIKSSPKTLKLDSKASFADIKPEDDHHETVTFAPSSTTSDFVYVRKSSQEKMLEKGTVRNNPFLKRNSTISSQGFSKRFQDLQNEVENELEGLIESAVAPKIEEIRHHVPEFKKEAVKIDRKYELPKGNNQMHIPRYQRDLNELDSKHFAKAQVVSGKSGIISKSRENSTIEIEESSRSFVNKVEEKVDISPEIQVKARPGKSVVEVQIQLKAEEVQAKVAEPSKCVIPEAKPLLTVELTHKKKETSVGGVNSIISRFNNAPQAYIPKPFTPKYIDVNKEAGKHSQKKDLKDISAAPDKPLKISSANFGLVTPTNIKDPLIPVDKQLSVSNENTPDRKGIVDNHIYVLNEDTPDVSSLADMPFAVLNENIPDARSLADKPSSILNENTPDLKDQQDKQTCILDDNTPDMKIDSDQLVDVKCHFEVKAESNFSKLDLSFDDLPQSNLRDILNANPHPLVSPIPFKNIFESKPEKVVEKAPILDKDGNEVFDISIVDFKKKSRGALRSVFNESVFPKVEEYTKEMPKTDSQLSEETQNVINKLRSITDNSEAVPITPKSDDLTLLVPQMGLSLEEDINSTINSLASFAKVKKDKPVSQYPEERSSRLSSVAGRSEKSYSEISITDSQVSRTFSRQSFISYRSESQQSERIAERYSNVSSKVFVSPGQMIASETELIEGSTNSPKRNEHRVFIILVEEIRGLQPSMLPSIKGQTFVQCVVEVESINSKTTKHIKSYYGDKIPFKIYTNSDIINVSYNKEIKVDIKNATKVTISVMLGIYPQEKKSIINFLTIGRSSRSAARHEYNLGQSLINMDQFLSRRPQSIPAVFQLLGTMNLSIATKCCTSSVD